MKGIEAIGGEMQNENDTKETILTVSTDFYGRIPPSFASFGNSSDGAVDSSEATLLPTTNEHWFDFAVLRGSQVTVHCQRTIQLVLVDVSPRR